MKLPHDDVIITLMACADADRLAAEEKAQNSMFEDETRSYFAERAKRMATAYEWLNELRFARVEALQNDIDTARAKMRRS